MSVITLIAKPVLFCNVRCRHCSVEHRTLYNFNPEFYALSLKKITDFLEKRSEKITAVEIVWHGGEPLLAGKDFYHQVFRHLKKEFPHMRIYHSIQTNLLLYDDSWNKVFESVFRWNVSTSYDFFSSLRPYSVSTFLDRLKKFQDRSGKPGYVICVLNKENDKKVLDICMIAEENGFHIKLNYLYPAGAARRLEFFTPVEYLRALKKVFEHRDEFPSVVIDPVDMFIDYAKGKIMELPCPVTNRCVGKIFALMPDGKIYQCGEMADIGEGYLGDVKNGIDQERFSELLEVSFVLDEKCMKCGLCGGGCLKQRRLYAGDMKVPTPFCTVWKEMYRSALNYLEKS
ncbi:hypothetical protein DRO29_07030 [Candidatus Bathyarchaeota archaeon]|nr:MAG: hypothetical protein DRO29_07030 [Candidatus Bathyarchaeota archaeon]